MTSTSVIRAVQTADGYELKYRVWSSSREGPGATVMFLNGVMSHSGWFEPLSAGLTSAGIKMVGADRRGTGENTVLRGDAPSVRHLVGDAAAIAAAEHAEGATLIVVGWCWGAVLAIHLYPALASRLDGIVFVAPGLCPTEGVSSKAALDHPGEGPEEEVCFPSPLSEDLFTSGPALNDFILRDPLRLKAFSRRFRAIMDRMALFAPRSLPKIEVPCMLVLADDDRATDNARTREVFDAISQLEHVSVPGQHGVQFDAPEELVAAVIEFVARR